MPCGRGIQVLVLDFCKDLFEDCRVREDHSLSIEDFQFLPPQRQRLTAPLTTVVLRRDDEVFSLRLKQSDTIRVQRPSHPQPSFLGEIAGTRSE